MHENLGDGCTSATLWRVNQWVQNGTDMDWMCFWWVWVFEGSLRMVSDLLIHLQQICQWIHKPACVRNMHMSVCACWQVLLVCVCPYIWGVSVCAPLLLQSLTSQEKTAWSPCQWLCMQYRICSGSRPWVLAPAFLRVASSQIAVIVSVGKWTWSVWFCIFIYINVYIVASWGQRKVSCSSCF